MSMDIYYILGIGGALFVLIAFFLSNNEERRKSLWDELLNFLGSLFLALYAWHGSMWPFFVLNVVWTLWSIKIFLREYRRKRPPVKK